jgi:hypothetical protein
VCAEERCERHEVIGTDGGDGHPIHDRRPPCIAGAGRAVSLRATERLGADASGYDGGRPVRGRGGLSHPSHNLFLCMVKPQSYRSL